MIDADDLGRGVYRADFDFDGTVDVDPADCPYVIAPADPRQKRCATFQQAKPGSGSGAGYERHRSKEWRPHTSRQSKEDVYVSHHRLLYLLSDELIELPTGEALEALDGCDVHHRNGVKWDNRLERREYEDEPHTPESNFELLDHGEHSSVTQSQMRAYAEDAKRAAKDPVEPAIADGGDSAVTCPRCGAELDGEYMIGERPDGSEACVHCMKQ